MRNDGSGTECTFIIVPSRVGIFDCGKAGEDKTQTANTGHIDKLAFKNLGLDHISNRPLRSDPDAVEDPKEIANHYHWTTKTVISKGTARNAITNQSVIRSWRILVRSQPTNHRKLRTSVSECDLLLQHVPAVRSNHVAWLSWTLLSCVSYKSITQSTTPAALLPTTTEILFFVLVIIHDRHGYMTF